MWSADTLLGKTVRWLLVERGLVEGDEPAGGARRGRCERAVDPFEDCLGLIVIAIVDEGRLGDTSGGAFGLGQEGVAATAFDKGELAAGTPAAS
jgi:hypothetical protein